MGGWEKGSSHPSWQNSRSKRVSLALRASEARLPGSPDSAGSGWRAQGVIRSERPETTQRVGGEGLGCRRPSRRARQSAHSLASPAPDGWPGAPATPPLALAAAQGGVLGAREGPRRGPGRLAGGRREGGGGRAPTPRPRPGASLRSPRPGRCRPAQRLSPAARRDALPPPPPLPPRPPSAPAPGLAERR